MLELAAEWGRKLGLNVLVMGIVPEMVKEHVDKDSGGAFFNCMFSSECLFYIMWWIWINQ